MRSDYLYARKLLRRKGHADSYEHRNYLLDATECCVTFLSELLQTACRLLAEHSAHRLVLDLHWTVQFKLFEHINYFDFDYLPF
jgi:hypothetical protein